MAQRRHPWSAPPFLGLPPELADPERAASALIPVPYDAASTWVKGADGGPQALLEASVELEYFDIETESEPARSGIATLPPVEFDGSPEALADVVASRVAAVLTRGQTPVVLGGDHSVAIGAMRAAASHFPDLTVLQLDAHADTRQSYQGSSHNHACVMARVREWCPIVQVGIRSLDASERAGLDRQRVFFAHELARRRDEVWMERVIAATSETVYVTIDLDVFDPSVLPATGTPEPGGLGWYDVTELLARLAARRRIIGFDVTELCPGPGQHASSFTAAKLVYRLLALIARGRLASSED